MYGKQLVQIASIAILLAVSTGARAEDMVIALGTGKARQLSGLFASILPIFKTASNVDVQVVALDSGDEMAANARGNVNALLLDNVSAVDKAMKDHYGLNPREAMYHDFVIVGPISDPANIRGLTDAAKAFARIAAKGAPFASADDGDAHRLELRLWKVS